MSHKVVKWFEVISSNTSCKQAEISSQPTWISGVLIPEAKAVISYADSFRWHPEPHKANSKIPIDFYYPGIKWMHLKKKTHKKQSLS